MSPRTLIDEMGVADVGFLIENLGKDAGELQYLRELTQNAFEAIHRAGRSVDGRVEIDYEEVEGIKKLRITDNGIGMTPDEVQDNINRLSASTGIQAFDKNFGIGAKITAAVRNPFGVMFKAWKDGEASLTILGRQEGHYGRLGWKNPSDDSVHYWLPLQDSDRHPIIDKNGVSVVLLGKSRDEDTTLAPAGADLPSQWVAAYLERKYFEIPAGITLKVLRPVEIYDSGRGTHRAIYDTIRGQRYYLNKHSQSKGIVDVPGARVWWWILSEEIVAGGKTWNNRGHVAAIYQGELYESRTGASRLSALKDFGIYAGHQRIVIYVEPSDVLGANTSRSALILAGNTPVNYAELGNAFAETMPPEIAAFMSGQVSSEQGDHRKSILRNLREVEDALDQARYRRSQKGRLESVQLENGNGPLSSESSRDTRSGVGLNRRTDASDRIGSEYLRKARQELERRLNVKKSEADNLPKIVWDEDGSTVQTGRAATYTRASNVITANARFELYLDLLEWSIDEAKSRVASDVDAETLRKICEDEVRRWFEEAMAQAVVVLKPMAHDERWGPRVFDTGLSDEGLTSAVVSHRWLIMSVVKRGLAGRLGRLKEPAA
jgi:hypothetical protein